MLFSVFLRFSTLASKFVLILFLAKYFVPAEVGRYGILMASISYSLYLLGFDFYNYTSRELLSKPQYLWAIIIRDQFCLYGIIYLLVLPILFLIFVANILPWNLAIWFFVLLALEHISQEMYRLLVVIQCPVLANKVLFVRSGLWVYLSIAILLFNPEHKSLDIILFMWATGAFFSILLAWKGFSKLDWVMVKDTDVSWSWLIRGVKIALPLLVATLALRGLFTIDRYILQCSNGDTSVGVYVFYANIANALQAAVDSSVVIHYYPKLIVSFKSGDLHSFKRYLKHFSISIMVVSIFTSIILIIFIPKVNHWIGKTEYISQYSQFIVLLSASFIYCIGLIPHFALYAKSNDKAILHASLLSFLVGSVFMVALSGSLGGLGVAIAILISMVSMVAYKFIILVKDY